MFSIKNVINALGYSNSNTLYYADSSEIKDNRSLQKLFRELTPEAIFLADNKPFIVFCESTVKNISIDLIKKVWNAQVPLLIISFENRIEIYNGCSIDNNKELILLDTIDDPTINENTSFSFWNITDAAFWKDYEQKLSAPKLDTVMFDNIKDATQQLKEKSAPICS
jgi:hypothetical protein